MSPIRYLTSAQLDDAVSLTDLSDPRNPPHAMQEIVANLTSVLTSDWGCQSLIWRSNPVVTVRENYDDLGYPPEGIARDSRYTRYLSAELLLRTQTSASIPGLLRAISTRPPDDLLIACPGLCYRRDVIDRLHVGEPHQLDLWRIQRENLSVRDLESMVTRVVDIALPGKAYRLTRSPHPYTENGVQIDVEIKGTWVEIGECGVAHPALLARCGLPPQYTGLAMGLGLDRLTMLRKGISDIRLLRSSDPRVKSQMVNLAPYRSISKQPATRRDLSICVEETMSEEEMEIVFARR